MAKEKNINGVIKKVLAFLGEDKFEIAEEKDLIKVDVESSDPGKLIGFHGETLKSLGYVLNALNRAQGNEKFLLVDVNNYKQERIKKLEEMAHSVARQAREGGKEVSFPPMSASERRTIHLVLAEEKGITAESQGEGPSRHIIIVPKEK